MEWKGGDSMGAVFGTRYNIGTDENPLSDAYEEMIKYNQEQRNKK